MIKFGSVCSGIEAASVAWNNLGWQASWLSEIEAFPSEVLSYHYPKVKNLGDMKNIPAMIKSGKIEAPEVLVGGTPCQAFSVAGLRGGLSDDRGALTIKFMELANEIDAVRLARGQQPTIIVWENVPGALSSKDNAFGCFLGGIAGEDCELQPSGKRWPNAGCVLGPERTIAWRVLDAQYFGLAQRRKRVFLVASARKGFDPTKILFEFDGVRRDIAPSREAGKEAADNAGASTKTASHWDGIENPHPTLSQSHNTGGIGASNQEIFSQRGAGLVQQGFRMTAFGEYADDDSASTMKARDYKDATDLVCVHGTQDPIISTERAHALGRNGGQENVIYAGTQNDALRDLGKEIAPTLRAGSNGGAIQQVAGPVYGIPGNWIGRSPKNGGNAVKPMANISPCLNATDKHGVSELMVRRLTPVECERLQGFPDNYTQIPWRNKSAIDCPDGHRYKALGNSMAVPVMCWIGERIDKYIKGK